MGKWDPSAELRGAGAGRWVWLGSGGGGGEEPSSAEHHGPVRRVRPERPWGT